MTTKTPPPETEAPSVVHVPIEDIGVLPTVVAKINALADDPSTDADRVARLILRDPSLTSKILHIINSSFYGLRQEVRSIQHAVAYLGIQQVRNLVVSSTLIESFRFDHGIVEPRAIWEHSLGCAIGSKRMGDMLPGIDGDLVYLGGLLHDLGRIVMISQFSGPYREVINNCERGLCTLREAEQARFDGSHEEIGEAVGRAWGFSDAVLTIIRHHHQPAEGGALAAAVAIVSFANAVCHHEGLRFGFSPDDDNFHENKEFAWHTLGAHHPELGGVNQQDVEAAVVESVQNAKAAVAELF